MQHYLASWLYYSLYSSLPIPALSRPPQTSSPRLVSYHSILVVTTEAPRGGERRLGWATSTASCMMAAYDGAVLFLELFDGKACRPASRLSPLHAVSASACRPFPFLLLSSCTWVRFLRNTPMKFSWVKPQSSPFSPAPH
ncbi:hypothetical protein GW17_00012378 [Ensete ventricosum]|nr:hypothetical protein GW17_00012378 [Ensete ventricosum]RZS14003.1 hypothetical protein BHM03_00045651 [Ensete ventricosum]